MRMLPFFKPKKGFMIAGGGLETSSSGGGGGGGGGGGSKYKSTLHTTVNYSEAETNKEIVSYTVEKDGYYLVSLTFNTDNNDVVGYVKHNDVKMSVTPQFIANYGSVRARTTTVVINATVNDTIKMCGDVLTYSEPSVDTYATICEL